MVNKHPGGQPEGQVQPGVAGSGEDHEDEALAEKEQGGEFQVAGLVKALKPGPYDTKSRHPSGVTYQFATQRGLSDGVKAVEQKVGFFRAEFVSMVAYVSDAVAVATGAEGQPADDLCAHEQ